MPNNRASYRYAPIGSLGTLSRVLGLTSEAELGDLIANAPKYYRPGKSQTKKDGTIRRTLQATGQLKVVQKRIHTKLLRNIDFPPYLMGSLPSVPNPRGPIANAEVHARAAVVLKFDVTQFFPSVSRADVLRIWKYLFRFPNDVAECLTDLTTYQGRLPQGVSTSSDLANLVFYDVEPKFVDRLAKRGVTYTRYIDDIILSSRQTLTASQKTTIVSDCISMMGRRGYRSQRRKQKIADKSKPQNITGFNVNAGRLTVPKSKRDAVRTAVHRLAISKYEERESSTYWTEYRRVCGRIRNLSPFHPKLASNLQETLEEVRPVVSNAMVNRLRETVQQLQEAPKGARWSTVFKHKLNRARYEVGTIRAARPREADKLLLALRQL